MRHPGANGSEGFPRPRLEVQGRQEQGHRPGQARQGAIKPGQAVKVEELTRCALGDSKRCSRQTASATPRRGQGR
jgi:hypothetical protein